MKLRKARTDVEVIKVTPLTLEKIKEIMDEQGERTEFMVPLIDPLHGAGEPSIRRTPEDEIVFILFDDKNVSRATIVHWNDYIAYNQAAQRTAGRWEVLPFALALDVLDTRPLKDCYAIKFWKSDKTEDWHWQFRCTQNNEIMAQAEGFDKLSGPGSCMENASTVTLYDHRSDVKIETPRLDEV